MGTGSYAVTYISNLSQRFDLDVPKLSALSGVNEPSCYDAIGDDQEVMLTWDIKNIASIARALGIRPSEVFTSENSETMLPEDFRMLLLRRISEGDLEKISDQVGWDVGDISGADYVTKLFDWCPEQLKDVCEYLKVDWQGVLNGICSVLRGNKI
jgi:hypothetical protein